MRPKHLSSTRTSKSTSLPILIGLFFALSGAVATAAGISPEEVIKLVNRSRLENNLSILSTNASLAAAAKAKADDMITHDYFAHTSPTGVEPWAWMNRSGYDYKYAGENLAINFTDAKEEHQAWMKSKTHRDNILSRQYTEVGVAVVTGKINGESAIITVQMFGAPRVAVGAAPRPTEPTSETLPAPAVQGMETALPSTSLAPVTAPVITPVPVVEPMSVSAPAAPIPRHLSLTEQIHFFMILLLALSIASPPVLILWRAYAAVFEMMCSRYQEFFLPPSQIAVKV